MKKIITMLSFFLLVACGGGGAGPTETEVQSAVQSFIEMIIPAAAAVEIPDGATATISIDGPSGTQNIVIDPNDPPVQFSDLLVGSYSVSVTVNNGGVEIGSFSDTVTIDESGISVTANIEFNRAELVVDPIVSADYEFLERDYIGRSRVSGDFQCISANGFSTDSSEIDLDMDATAITLNIDNFFGEGFLLNGIIDDSSGALLASGTYQSTDFKAGTWNITYLATPTSNAISISIDFENDTDSCSGSYEYAGLAK